MPVFAQPKGEEKAGEDPQKLYRVTVELESGKQKVIVGTMTYKKDNTIDVYGQEVQKGKKGEETLGPKVAYTLDNISKFVLWEDGIGVNLVPIKGFQRKEEEVGTAFFIKEGAEKK